MRVLAIVRPKRGAVRKINLTFSTLGEAVRQVRQLLTDAAPGDALYYRIVLR